MKKRRKIPAEKTAPAAGGLSAVRKAAQEKLLYEGNPKHREPWQPGRRGSLCPKEISIEQAQALLLESHEFKGSHYAVHEGRLYEARDNNHGRWHGYPIGWVEAPQPVRVHFEKSGLVKRHDLKRFWKR